MHSSRTNKCTHIHAHTPPTHTKKQIFMHLHTYLHTNKHTHTQTVTHTHTHTHYSYYSEIKDLKMYKPVNCRETLMDIIILKTHPFYLFMGLKANTFNYTIIAIKKFKKCNFSSSKKWGMMNNIARQWYPFRSNRSTGNNLGKPCSWNWLIYRGNERADGAEKKILDLEEELKVDSYSHGLHRLLCPPSVRVA